MSKKESNNGTPPLPATEPPPIIPLVFVPALMGSELEEKEEEEDSDSDDENKYKQKKKKKKEKEKEKSDLAYVNWKIGLNLQTPDLSLPLKWEFRNDHGDHNHDDRDNGHGPSSSSSSSPLPSQLQLQLPTQAKDNLVPRGVVEKIQIECCSLSSCCLQSITVLDQYSSFCQHYRKLHLHQSTSSSASSSSSSSESTFHTFAYDWRRDLNETTDALLEYLEEIYIKHGARPQVVSHRLVLVT